jgi:hypothetical protein
VTQLIVSGIVRLLAVPLARNVAVTPERHRVEAQSAVHKAESQGAGALRAIRNCVARHLESWTGYFALAAFETVAGNTVSQSCSVDSITNLLNPFGTPLLSEEVISSAIARRSLPDSATVTTT